MTSNIDFIFKHDYFDVSIYKYMSTAFNNIITEKSLCITTI